MINNKKIALIIPAYNEERLIIPTLEGVPEYVDKVYVVDDASIDATCEKVLEYSKKDNRIELIKHSDNQGPGGAILTGYEKAYKDGYDIFVVTGGDNQMPLDQIPDLVEPLIKKQADYTKGNRFLMPDTVFGSMPKIRIIGNTLITAMTKIASGYYKIYDVVEGFTAITRGAYERVEWHNAWRKYGYPMDFLIRANTYGLKVKDVPRRAIYLKGERQSQIKGLDYAIKVTPMLVKGFFRRLIKKYLLRDFHPLFFFYIFGILFLPLGLLYGIYLILKQIVGIGVSGPQSILCALLVITGLQFLLFAMFFDMEEGK